MTESISGTSSPALRPTSCAICGRGTPAETVYPANFTLEDLSVSVFSARRLPDRVHYRMVRCSVCGLLRSDPVADDATLERLYVESTFDYSDEVPVLAASYGRYLARVAGLGGTKGALLEVGAGNGFFLLEALRQGYREVTGVEPSTAAIAGADAAVRGRLIADVMRPGLIPDESIDVICLFQVLDHLADPVEVLSACRAALAPEGRILVLNHDEQASSARILKERSPIIDIEHTYLYSQSTVRLVLEAAGFRILETGSVQNTVRLAYLVQLLPLPAAAKRTLTRLLAASRLGGLSVRLPLGNLYAIAARD